MEQIIDEILKQITREEKAKLVCGASFFGVSGIESLGMTGAQLLDGGTGINYEQLFGDILSRLNISEGAALSSGTALSHVIEYYYHPERLNAEELQLRAIIKRDINERLEKHTTNKSLTAGLYHQTAGEGPDLMSPGCFPTGMLLGATWDKETVYELGKALGREARAYGVHVLLGTPNINIHRDPLAGRLFEGFSEDPYLVSELAPSEVQGVQAEGVAANVKHFAANNQETNRQGINETISERAMHEIYLPGFKACVEEGKAATLMSAYNQINNIPCTENHWLLTDMLRDLWGFNGLVTSDWGAVTNQINALKAGNDVSMPGPVAIDIVMEALESGELTEEELDINAGRVIKLLLDYGNPDRYENSCQYIMDMSKKAAYKAACEGIVMLKNERGIFPLKDYAGADGAADSAFAASVPAWSGKPKVYLCGSGAVSFFDCGTGSAGITTDRTTHLHECLMEDDIDVIVGEPQGVADEVVICAVRVNGMEGNDREDMNLMPSDAELLDRLVHIRRRNPRVRLGVILNVCGPVDLMPWISDIDGLFCVFLPGMEGARAMADILAGKVNPSGKLPLTFPKQYKDTPTCINFPGDGHQVCYGEGIYVGYRYYDKTGREPLFPFGHGLSYTTFRIDNMRTSVPVTTFAVPDAKGLEAEYRMPVIRDSFAIYVDIENTGRMDGAEVLQLYVADVESTLPKPVKELKAFQKVRLKAGEKQRVEFRLDFKDFASFDSDRHAWTIEEGIYRIMIGTGSRSIVCSADIYLDVLSPYSYGPDSTIKAIYENAITRDMLQRTWQRLGLDWGHIESQYQYVPSTLLKDQIATAAEGISGVDAVIDDLYARLSAIKRK